MQHSRRVGNSSGNSTPEKKYNRVLLYSTIYSTGKREENAAAQQGGWEQYRPGSVDFVTILGGGPPSLDPLSLKHPEALKLKETPDIIFEMAVLLAK